MRLINIKEKIGAIRFERENSEVKTNVMLNPDFLGKGLGCKVIKLGVERFIKEKKADMQIIVEIKKGNIASIKAFGKLVSSNVLLPMVSNR